MGTHYGCVATMEGDLYAQHWEVRYSLLPCNRPLPRFISAMAEIHPSGWMCGLVMRLCRWTVSLSSLVTADCRQRKSTVR